jgi:hypothetical protein
MSLYEKCIRGLHWRLGRRIQQLSRTEEHNQAFLPSVRYLAENQVHVTCGYYDVTPFDAGDSRVLALHIDHSLRTPAHGSRAILGYYDISQTPSPFHRFAESVCWNWQQGSRLRWCPSLGENVVAYNDVIDDRYCCVYMDIEAKKRLSVLPRAAYDIAPDNSYALSLNFSRLHRLRPGYGYGYLPDQSDAVDAPVDDGVWRIDTHSGGARMLCDLKTISQILPHASMEHAEHYINHIAIAPDGKHFIFFHLWLNKGSGKRYSRLFVSMDDGAGLKLLNNSGHVSHYTWMNNQELLVTTHVEDQNLRYVRYNLNIGFSGIVGVNQLREDGHPSPISDDYVMTDTYPDSERYQRLLIYDMARQEKREVAKWVVPAEFTGEVRCDLHPRPSRSRKKVAVDVVHEGCRAIAILDMDDIWKSVKT